MKTRMTESIRLDLGYGWAGQNEGEAKEGGVR